jgi:transposase InsO family protein
MVKISVALGAVGRPKLRRGRKPVKPFFAPGGPLTTKQMVDELMRKGGDVLKTIIEFVSELEDTANRHEDADPHDVVTARTLAAHGRGVVKALSVLPAAKEVKAMGGDVVADAEKLTTDVHAMLVWLDENVRHYLGDALEAAERAKAGRTEAARAERETTTCRLVWAARREGARGPLALTVEDVGALRRLRVDLRMSYAGIAALLNAKGLHPVGRPASSRAVETICQDLRIVQKPAADEVDIALVERFTAFMSARHPHNGVVSLIGSSRNAGLAHVSERKLRRALKAHNPVGSQMRLMQNIVRREYNVSAAQILWHADGCHHLILYGIVIHGIIDGYSRLIVSLVAADNNRAETVGTAFVHAALEHGVPRMYRTDFGLENSAVWATIRRFREDLGFRTKAILYSSVHNQRIERFWKDASRFTTALAAELKKWEANSLLNPGAAEDLHALHYTILPYVSREVERFKDDWNAHTVRTTGETPNERHAASQLERVKFVQPLRIGADGQFMSRAAGVADLTVAELRAVQEAVGALDDVDPEQAQEARAEELKRGVELEPPRSRLPWWDAECSAMLAEWVQPPPLVEFDPSMTHEEAALSPYVALRAAFKNAKTVVYHIREVKTGQPRPAGVP